MSGGGSGPGWPQLCQRPGPIPNYYLIVMRIARRAQSFDKHEMSTTRERREGQGKRGIGATDERH